MQLKQHLALKMGVYVPKNDLIINLLVTVKEDQIVFIFYTNKK